MTEPKVRSVCLKLLQFFIDRYRTRGSRRDRICSVCDRGNTFSPIVYLSTLFRCQSPGIAPRPSVPQLTKATASIINGMRKEANRRHSANIRPLSFDHTKCRIQCEPGNYLADKIVAKDASVITVTCPCYLHSAAMRAAIERASFSEPVGVKCAKSKKSVFCQSTRNGSAKNNDPVSPAAPSRSAFICEEVSLMSESMTYGTIDVEVLPVIR